MRGKTITRDDLEEIVKAYTGPYWGSGYKFAGYGDNEYYLPTDQEIRELLQKELFHETGPHDEGFDCDDYSFVLKGNAALYARRHWKVSNSIALGIAWGYFGWRTGSHCCNWVVTADEVFSWIEPMDPLEDCFHKAEECDSGLTLVLV